MKPALSFAKWPLLRLHVYSDFDRMKKKKKNSIKKIEHFPFAQYQQEGVFRLGNIQISTSFKTISPMTLNHDVIHKLWLNPTASFFQVCLYIYFVFKNKIIFLNIALYTKLEKQVKHKLRALRFISKQNWIHQDVSKNVKCDYCSFSSMFVMKNMRKCASPSHDTLNFKKKTKKNT